MFIINYKIKYYLVIFFVIFKKMLNFITPLLLPKIINSNVIMRYPIIKEENLSWEKIKYYENFNFKHFDNILSENKNSYLELLKINGYPALIIIVDNKYKYIKEFVLNKKLILFLDAGPLIRLSYYKKFKNIPFEHAINKNIFLII